MSSSKSPYKLGREHCSENRDITDNPYSTRTDDFFKYQDGYLDYWNEHEVWRKNRGKQLTFGEVEDA